MKRPILLIIAAAMTVSTWAQGPQKPPPPEERWKHDSQKIIEKAQLDKASVEKAKPAFLQFYKDMDALMEKNKGERPKREAVEPLIAKRNDAVKKVWNANAYAAFTKIERQLGPPPPRGERPPEGKQ